MNLKSKSKGQAFFYGIIGVLLAMLFLGAAAPLISNSITAATPFLSVNAQIMAGLILVVIPLAIIIGFWKALNPSAT